MTDAKVGPAPFGYKREGGRLVLDPEEAPVRLRMFELFAEHERKKTVAEILNAEGHTTRAEAMFTAQTINRLLTDERVKGVPNEVEILVPEELWERCHAILRSQKNKGAVTRKVAHLFSGFIFCDCGQKMYVPSSTKKYNCSDCKRKIATEVVEDIFYSQLKNYSFKEGSNHFAFENKWSVLPFENKRRIVESITNRIEVSDKKVTCYLFIL